jgi:hypothetical protein
LQQIGEGRRAQILKFNEGFTCAVKFCPKIVLPLSSFQYDPRTSQL